MRDTAALFGFGERMQKGSGNIMPRAVESKAHTTLLECTLDRGLEHSVADLCRTKSGKLFPTHCGL